MISAIYLVQAEKYSKDINEKVNSLGNKISEDFEGLAFTAYSKNIKEPYQFISNSVSSLSQNYPEGICLVQHDIDKILSCFESDFTEITNPSIVGEFHSLSKQLDKVTRDFFDGGFAQLKVAKLLFENGYLMSVEKGELVMQKSWIGNALSEMNVNYIEFNMDDSCSYNLPRFKFDSGEMKSSLTNSMDSVESYVSMMLNAEKLDRIYFLIEKTYMSLRNYEKFIDLETKKISDYFEHDYAFHSFRKGEENNFSVIGLDEDYPIIYERLLETELDVFTQELLSPKNYRYRGILVESDSNIFYLIPSGKGKKFLVFKIVNKESSVGLKLLMKHYLGGKYGR